MRVITLVCLVAVAAPAVHAQSKPAAPETASTSTSAKLNWGPAPAVFPKGAKMAVVSGDPAAAAPSVVEFSMPDGYRIPPHFHPVDERVEVKQGTFLMGMGDNFDASKAKPMNAGDKGLIPAKMHHYASAKGATVIEVTATGPFSMTYVNSADDPQKKSANP
jgi:quercetin dioxygenase-like cupin family protein